MPYNDLRESNPEALMEYLMKEFNKRNLGFVEVNENFNTSEDRPLNNKLSKTYRKNFNGTWISNNDFT